MNTLSFKILVLAFLTIPMTASAFVTARGSFGIIQSKQKLSDICSNCVSASSAPEIGPLANLGADALIKLPLIPIGFGLRYENMSLSSTSGNYEASLKYSRTALLLNYRLIDTIVHFGPIVSYGLSHSGSMSLKESGVSRVDISASSMSSYSLGLELEVKPLIIIPLIVGAEAGYMGFKWNDVTNSVDGSKKSLDMSGTYVKVFLGIDI
jgi:hypothetical protein